MKNKLFLHRTVLDEFDEKNRVNRTLVIQTPSGSVVQPHQLKNIVEQFKGCGCFALRIMYTDLMKPSLSALAQVNIFICVIELKIMWFDMYDLSSSA